MKLSSGATISKSTLKRSVRAIKEQDVLRNFSKDSADKGVYVSIAYAPDSGKPQNAQQTQGQFIYVTIHNIPRFNGEAEAMQVQPFANLYYRIEPNGKIYKHTDQAGEFASGPEDKNYNRLAPRSWPTFIQEPKSWRGPNFLRPWIEVNDNGHRYLDYNKGEASPKKYDGLFHPKMVSADPDAALAGVGPYMMGDSIYANGSLEYKWIANGDYIDITYPMGIHQALLPDRGVIGLIDIIVTVTYKEFYEGSLSNPAGVTFFDNAYAPSSTSINTGISVGERSDQSTHFKRGGEYHASVYGQQISSTSTIRDRGGYKDAGYKDPLSSVNELPLYGMTDYALRLAQRGFYPWIHNGLLLATNSIRGYDVLDSNYPHNPYNTYWPELSMPKLILSEDGAKAQKTTIGSWWSKDPQYGRSIAYRCEWQRNYKDTGWQTYVTQNAQFIKSNIKSENLQPVTEDIGAISLQEVDQDYLNYFFQAYNDGFDIQGTDETNGSWNGIRVKITAKLELNGVTHYAHVFSTAVSIPELAVLSYYYYGGDGIGLSNLD